jgi:hypothetical protein
MLLYTNVKLFALIDIKKVNRRLYLAKLLQAALRRIKEIAQSEVALGKAVSPLLHASHPARIKHIKLPQP